MSTFGLKLKELRHQAGLTQEELSEKAGIDRTTLARLETDVSVPAWPTVLLLAKTLGVSCEEFPDVANSLKGADKRHRPARSAKNPPADVPAAKKSARRKGKG